MTMTTGGKNDFKLIYLQAKKGLREKKIKKYLFLNSSFA